MSEETHYKVVPTGGPIYKLCQFPMKTPFTMAQFSDPKLKITCKACLAYRDILPAQYQPWEENNDE